MQNITVNELLKQYSLETLLGDNDIELVDVRRVEENQHEKIRNAKHVSFEKLGELDAETCQNKIAIFYCRTGNRTDINQAALESTPYKQKYCIDGGITAWKAANLPTEKTSAAPIDIMRQVQLIVSLMILIGLCLNMLVSPYFLILPLFAGLGLLVASLTGFCGMANLLKYMPWNKQTQ